MAGTCTAEPHGAEAAVGRGDQDGEQEKQKSYLARCRLPCPVTARHLEQLNATRDLLLQQRTPTRVEHRRAMLVRSLLPSCAWVLKTG